LGGSPRREIDTGMLLGFGIFRHALAGVCELKFA
jgi:hypothetical protein